MTSDSQTPASIEQTSALELTIRQEQAIFFLTEEFRKADATLAKYREQIASGYCMSDVFAWNGAEIFTQEAYRTELRSIIHFIGKLGQPDAWETYTLDGLIEKIREELAEATDELLTRSDFDEHSSNSLSNIRSLNAWRAKQTFVKTLKIALKIFEQPEPNKK